MAKFPKDDQPTSSDVTRLSTDRRDRESRLEVPDQDVLSSRERLGDFRLIRQIGHGGMGVVYEAEQLSLARKVAIKVLPFASMLNPQHRKRFHNEARAAATLDHPNIVPVYFVGEERGVHFYAMHLIEGQSMADLIATMRGDPPQSPTAPELLTNPERDIQRRDTGADFHTTISTQRSEHSNDYFLTVARLGAEAAEALEHAHQVGILHRDIKPGNLMIDNTGKLWITDFGLASIEHGETLTRTGGIVGTAAYMSPEQAKDSHRVDNRSDIYSLGATLYEMLTLSKHRSDEPTRVEVDAATSDEMISFPSVAKTPPTDLETIILKALSVEPADRYDSAEGMGQDLRAYIDGREIKARRLSLIQRVSRRLRRHRRLTTAATMLSFVLIAAFGTVMWLNSLELERALSDARSSRIDAIEQAEIAARSEAAALRSARRALDSERLAKASELATRRMSYRSDMQHAYESFGNNKFSEAARLLAKQIPHGEQTDLRGVEWSLLRAEVDARLVTLGTHAGEATECVLFPDGNTVATAGTDGLIKIWDLGSVTQRDTFAPKVGAIHAMAISPDGETLAVAGSVSTVTLGFATIHLLDAKTGRRKVMSQTHRTTIESIAFSPDGEKIAAASRYESAFVSTTAGKYLHKLRADARNDSIAFSPDGKLLAVRHKGHKIRIWDCDRGESVADVNCSGRAVCICWSPTQNYLICAGTNAGIIDVVDTNTWKIFATLAVPEPQPLGITALHISDQGQTVWAGDVQGQIHQWTFVADNVRAQAEGEGERPQIEPVALRRGVDSVGSKALVGLADGRVVSVHHDGNVQLSIPTTNVADIQEVGFQVSAAGVFPDSALCLGSTDGSVHRFDIRSGRATEILPHSGSRVGDLAVSRDGTKFAVVYDSRRVELIDANSKEPLWTDSREHRDPDPMYRVAISSDARFLARAGNDHQLSIWDTEQNKSIFHRTYSGSGWSVAFAPSGKILAHGQDGVNVFELPAGKSLFRFSNERANAIQFADDGRIAVSGHDDGSVRLFDLDSGIETIMRGHAGQARCVVFDPGGRTVLSTDMGGQRDTLRLWDVESGEAYGVIANPLSPTDTEPKSACKIAVFPNRIVLCKVGTPSPRIAVWNLDELPGRDPLARAP